MTSISHHLYAALGPRSVGQALGRAIHQPLVQALPPRRVHSRVAGSLFLALLILMAHRFVR